MPRLLNTLFALSRCPHCGIDNPNLSLVAEANPKDLNGLHHWWRFYACSRCGSATSATSGASNSTNLWGREATRWFPTGREVADDIPERPRRYLMDALNAMAAPSGAVMLAASAVDAMLKAKGLREGKLYRRIEKAMEDHLITPEMGRWAHEIRLDANDERHADEDTPLPTQEDAQKCLDFAFALADLLFVLPARVERGIAAAEGPSA